MVKRPSIEEMECAVEWLRAYEGSGTNDNMGEALSATADWLEHRIAEVRLHSITLKVMRKTGLDYRKARDAVKRQMIGREV